ncbi:hypothetical protein KSP39_PZI007510 [Platanthera zijinensis]|uniref:Uncharacterized protein n=1 Tax=Platanthera zijinensis TaxID=2320716 RepID=A0AAP0BRT3_9ASPA
MGKWNKNGMNKTSCSTYQYDLIKESHDGFSSPSLPEAVCLFYRAKLSWRSFPVLFPSWPDLQPPPPAFHPLFSGYTFVILLMDRDKSWMTLPRWHHDYIKGSIIARVKDELTQEILSTVLINLQRDIPNLDSDSIIAGLAAGIQSPGDAISGHWIRNASSSSYVPFDLNKFPGDEIPIIRGSALSALNGTNDEIGRQAILNLTDVVDGYIPDSITQLDKPFLMPIEDVFSIQVTVKVVRGPIVHEAHQQFNTWISQVVLEAYQKGAQAHHNAGQPAREKYHKLAPEWKAAHGKTEMEDATNEQKWREATATLRNGAGMGGDPDEHALLHRYNGIVGTHIKVTDFVRETDCLVCGPGRKVLHDKYHVSPPDKKYCGKHCAWQLSCENSCGNFYA